MKSEASHMTQTDVPIIDSSTDQLWYAFCQELGSVYQLLLSPPLASSARSRRETPRPSLPNNSARQSVRLGGRQVTQAAVPRHKQGLKGAGQS